MQIRSPATNVLSVFCTLIFVVSLLLSPAQAQQPLPDAPSPKVQTKQAPPNSLSATTQSKGPSESSWPRIFTSGTDTFTIYPPQMEKWNENVITLYCAVEFKSRKESAAKYGVVWFEARTEVDKINRLVTLDQAKVAKVKFPVAQEKERELTASLEKRLAGATKIISLDRLEAELETDDELVNGVDVKNDPPKVIITSKPSLQVLIDGTPQMREVPGTKLLRVINTRSIILYEGDKELYFLRVQDWWLQGKKFDGPWEYAKKLPDDMKKAEEFIVSQNQAQNPEGEQTKEVKEQPSLKESGKKAIPAVYVVYGPAELIETKGEPQFSPIPGTGLEYVVNTTGNIFRAGGEYYLLLSGRWFKGASLSGPWVFVSAAQMPSDFLKIPPGNPKATVLASVPGTAQAKEALIANSIPQTATITRSEAKVTVQYDGEATFEPIEGTSMSYAKNTSAEVIKVSDKDYYCVEAGVWFKSSSPDGPWLVADKVPAEIYGIPPSSPLYNLTYVKVYGSTPEVVYVGYTPGYYGTVVSAETKTVVYGTGWYYPPYVSTVWYGWPYTYGVGAGFTYSEDAGWSFGFGYGYGYYPYYPWWGPMGYYGCCWYPYYGWGAWGGAVAANVYGVWGNTAYSRTGAAWANPYTGNYGAATRGAYYNTQTGRSTVAGRGYNTNIYTGNTAGYRGGVTYNPNTGIVAGGGAGYVGNIYTGQGAANRGGFIYNTNTNTGIAAGKNNIYAGKDGTVYRYNRDSGSWSSNSGNGWQSIDKPEPKLQNQREMRNKGAQRTQNFNSTRRFGGARMGGGRRR